MIPLYTPECGDCLFCKSPKSNLCFKVRSSSHSFVFFLLDYTACYFCHHLRPSRLLLPSAQIRGTQGKGVMPDGSGRYKNMKGESVGSDFLTSLVASLSSTQTSRLCPRPTFPAYTYAKYPAKPCEIKQHARNPHSLCSLHHGSGFVYLGSQR